jgi:carboxylate-amine ligase
MPTTIGVEEEFVLVDPATLTPVERAAEAHEHLRHAGHRDGAVMREFFSSQLEFASPVCRTAGEALAALTGFRAELSAWAAARGIVAAGVGVPYRVAERARVSESDRYRGIAAHFGRIVPDHQINGLHVHVGVDDRDAAVRALNTLRPWLPTLLALSANSPYWEGADTGFDSWRTIHSRRWTTHGIPPPFRDAADYDRRTAALLGIGGTSDTGTLNWVARPSERYPTIEVRVFDAQLDASTSVALATLVRGIVRSPPPDAARDPHTQSELLDSALWHAARNGLGADLVDPRDGRLRPAEQVAQALLQEASPGLAEHDDLESAGTAVERILSQGNGASRQRAALHRGGVPVLAELIRSAGEEGA